MRRVLIVLLPLVATACATPRQPAVEVQIQKVYVPQLKPCPAKVPVRPGKLGALPGDANAALAATLSKLGEYSAPGKYADEAELYFRVCPPVAPAP